MKRIIQGVTYNTDTASLVARYEYENDSDQIINAHVYHTRGGAFFIVHMSETSASYIEPSDRESIDRLMTEGDNVEIIDNDILEDPPEATASAPSEATIFVRVTATLKSRLEEEAKKDSLSMNAYALRCFERCLARPRIL